jgi:thiosulfate/3-mercaptopyruvate sulfurtransferase
VTQLIISPVELNALLVDPNVVVIDCRFQLDEPTAGRAMYDEGHISGAHYADLNQDLSSTPTEMSGRHPLPSLTDWVQCLSRWGISNESVVVAYDQLGGPLAARFWWLMRWSGHDQVAVLDGGFPAWERAGFPVDSKSPTAAPSTFVPSVRHDAWVSSADVEQAISENLQSGFLCDARAAKRYRGEVEPIDPIAGHIPTATNLPFVENLDESGCFRSAEELKQRFEALSEAPQDVFHMCGSGVTACHNLLAMEIAGLTGSKLYVGSWSEWIQHADHPVATGPE